jgi:hypothetical protein
MPVPYLHLEVVEATERFVGGGRRPHRLYLVWDEEATADGGWFAVVEHVERFLTCWCPEGVQIAEDRRDGSARRGRGTGCRHEDAVLDHIQPPSTEPVGRRFDAAVFLD